MGLVAVDARSQAKSFHMERPSSLRTKVHRGSVEPTADRGGFDGPRHLSLP